MILVIKLFVSFLALIMLGVVGDIVSGMLNANNTLIAGLVEVIVFIYLVVKLMLKIYKRLFTL